ncbi:hypothetical protein Q3W71_21940 [Micromonospora sp. C28SCA-DRY-2]|nr:hypothetical protein [Micromonospora sp. C28SCA-DRY-2]MDO3704328.1 hypothetical protein [Micromonospora sp. C28SCA-DRY-2]
MSEGRTRVSGLPAGNRAGRGGATAAAEWGSGGAAWACWVDC